MRSTRSYNLREVIGLIDELRFRSQTDKHELSQLYEEKIKRMGNAGRNGIRRGNYSEPRLASLVEIRVTFPTGGDISLYGRNHRGPEIRCADLAA
jgi:type I restriction enzyme M protein